MTKEHRKYSLWQSVRSLGPRQLFLCWDFITAFVIGGFGTFFYTWFVPQVADHVAVAGDFVALTGALFGIVIAGLAIVSTVLDKKYSRFIETVDGSVYGLLRHFVVDGGLLVTAISSGIIYRAIATEVHRGSPVVEYCLFGFCVFMFFWALFGAFQILKLVYAIADVGSKVSASRDSPESDQLAS